MTLPPPLDPAILEHLRRSAGFQLDRDGRWRIHGAPITHARSQAALYEGLDFRDDGEVTVGIGGHWAYVDVADTPLVVDNLRGEALDAGGLPAHIILRLSDGRREPLDPTTLQLRADDELVCRVREGRVAARLARAARHNLLPWLHVDDAGAASLRLASGDHRITTTDDDEG